MAAGGCEAAEDRDEWSESDEAGRGPRMSYRSQEVSVRLDG
jgi:hypothetical protein